MASKKWIFAGLLCAALSAGAGTIVTVTGTGPNSATGNDFYFNANYVSWSMGSTSYTDVTISAALWEEPDPTSTGVIAYLYEGSTFATATLVDTSAFISVTGSQGGTYTTLFTGLTLTAGDTYYLAIVDDDTDCGCHVFWEASDDPTVNTGAGVTNLTPDYTSKYFVSDGTLPGRSSIDWNTTHKESNESFLYQVTGSPASGVPEPATLGLMATGLGAALLFRRRKA